MSYKVKIGDLEIECNTPEEVLDLSNKNKLVDVIVYVKPKKEKKIKSSKEFISTQKFAKILGYANGGGFAKLFKQAFENGIKPNFVLRGNEKFYHISFVNQIIEWKKKYDQLNKEKAQKRMQEVKPWLKSSSYQTKVEKNVK